MNFIPYYARELTHTPQYDERNNKITNFTVHNFPDLNRQAFSPLSANEIPMNTYLIVTTNDFKSNSSQLPLFIQYKQACGFNVETITEDEFGTATGRTRALNIRSWLKNHYQSQNITHVLLIGDPDPDDEDNSTDSVGNIPMMMCWPMNNGTGIDYQYEESPTDYFYADLTGDWNSDGDLYYGEFGYSNTTPEDSGVDFNAEVYVGRIPIYNKDYTSADNILTNTIYHHHQFNRPLSKYRMLEPMAISNYANEDGETINRADGQDVPEYVYNNILHDVGINDTVLYEQAGLNPVSPSAFHYDQALNKSNVIDAIKSGQGAILWWGHGSTRGVWRKYWQSDNGDGIPDWNEMIWAPFLDTSDLSGIHHVPGSFIYQSSCDNGCPEDSSNFAYELLKSGVGITTVASSRVSWYNASKWSPLGYSSFTDNIGLGYQYMMNLLKLNQTAGEALFNAKANGGEEWNGVSWMNKMDFNLLGDPHLNYWGSNRPFIGSSTAPANGGTIHSDHIELSLHVNDSDSEYLNVVFYNASNDKPIGWDLHVANDSIASVVWTGLNKSHTHSWYAIISDGQAFSRTEYFSFSVGSNYYPEVCSVSPSQEQTHQTLTVNLSVDIQDTDGDPVNISFYNNHTGQLIGIDQIPSGNGTASVLWSSLNWSTEYYWYVMLDDGINITTSSIFSFSTNYLPIIKGDPNPNPNSEMNQASVTLSITIEDYDGDTLAVSFFDASDDTLIGTDTVTAASGTAETSWEGLSENSAYTWYVIVDDGIASITSEIYEFEVLEFEETNTTEGFKIPGFPLIFLIGCVWVVSIVLYIHNKAK